MNKKYILLPPRGHRIMPKQLAKLAGIQQVSYEKNKPIKLAPNSLVINWGNSTLIREFNISPARFLNPPSAVQTAISKIATFEALQKQNLIIPEFTTKEEEAKDWFKGGYVVYTRTKDQASQGIGIHVQIPSDETIDRKWREVRGAKFHTKRFKGKYEYRIHVLEDKIIHIQQKKRKINENQDADIFIKNHINGYVFTIQDVKCPKILEEVSIKAIKACGLNFGAVDISYAPTLDKYCIFEINTRPALVGTTLFKYGEAFDKYGINT